MASTEHVINIAMSSKKQTAYGTKLENTDLTLTHDFLSANLPEKKITKLDNREHYGKGHEYPTRQTNTVIDTRLSLDFEASSLILGWLAAFGGGKVVTVQPDPVNAPDTYEHTIEPMNIFDPLIGHQHPATSLVFQRTPSIKELYRDMVLQEFTISGKRTEQIKISAQLVGSGFYEISALTFPAESVLAFLMTGDLSITIDGVAKTAGLIDFSFKHSNALAEDMGYFPGSGHLDPDDLSSPQIRGKCLTESRASELEFRMEMDDESYYDDMLANTEREIVITGIGPEIDTGFSHGFELTIPRVFFSADTQPGREGKFFTWDVKALIAYDVTNNRPWVLKVTNDQASYLA